MEAEKSTLEKDRASLDRKRSVLEKEVAGLTEKLSAAQAAATMDAQSMAARNDQAAANIER